MSFILFAALLFTTQAIRNGKALARNARLKEINSELTKALRLLKSEKALSETAVGEWEPKYGGPCKEDLKDELDMGTCRNKKFMGGESPTCECYGCPSDRIMWDTATWSGIQGCCDEGTAFHWDGSCKPIKPKCEDTEIMDGEMTCGQLSDMLGDLCKSDYGAPGAVCECMCKKEAVSVGVEECDDYCQTWQDFKDGKEKDGDSKADICGYYKSDRCKMCLNVQHYCGWKQILLDEDYTYTSIEGGKCQTMNKEDPKHEYLHAQGSECEEKCNERNDCFGYSISGYDNCLHWLQRDIMAGGEEWGGASCNIIDITCSGNVGMDYNCVECFHSGSQKYLWGNVCSAKVLGQSTRNQGKCGLDYKCYTEGEDIGECEYDSYCPMQEAAS